MTDENMPHEEITWNPCYQQTIASLLRNLCLQLIVVEIIDLKYYLDFRISSYLFDDWSSETDNGRFTHKQKSLKDKILQH